MMADILHKKLEYLYVSGTSAAFKVAEFYVACSDNSQVVHSFTLD